MIALHINNYILCNIFVAYFTSGTQARNSKEEIYSSSTYLSCNYENGQDGDVTETNRQGKKGEEGFQRQIRIFFFFLNFGIVGEGEFISRNVSKYINFPIVHKHNC